MSFPTTRGSALVAARSADETERRRGYAAIIATYWRPCYAYLRLRWRESEEDARDLVQGFFAHAFERGFLESYDPVRARFRTWLRVCLDGYTSNQRQAESRLKRGGGVAPLSLDFATAEAGLAARLPVSTDDPETLFEREWVRGFLEDALESLRAECESRGKTIAWEAFRRYDVEDNVNEERPYYFEIAHALGIPESQVTNHIHWARREYRRIVMERLRELTIDEREFRSEARRLLGRREP